MSLLNLHIAAALVAVAQGGVAELAYDNHGIDLGESISQTVVHGRLTSGSADDLIVFSHDERGRQMAVYAYDGGTWSRVHFADVPNDVIFVDMINLGGRDRLLALRREGVDWIDPETWALKPWLSAASMYKVPPPDVRELNIALDLNGDELDDIALPGFDGYTVWIQRPDGSLTDPVELAGPPTTRTGFVRRPTGRGKSTVSISTAMGTGIWRSGMATVSTFTWGSRTADSTPNPSRSTCRWN